MTDITVLLENFTSKFAIIAILFPIHLYEIVCLPTVEIGGKIKAP